MKWIKQLFVFYLDASIHVSFAVIALLELTWYFFEKPREVHISYFIFFGTISCYNFVKYGVEAKKYILVSHTYHRKIQLISVLALGAAVYNAFYLDANMLLGLMVLGFATALYAIPMWPKSKNLRSLGGLKIFIVAMVWAGTTVFLPMIPGKDFLSWDVAIEGGQRFIFVLALMLPFEIRDLKYDAPELKTLPQRFGIPKVKRLGTLLMSIFFLLTFFKDSWQSLELFSKGVVAVLLGAMIWYTKENQSTYFASFWVEAIPIFWWGLILGLGYWI
ncbi:hypothetical protein SAMN04487911_10736 [Arenibacter nanhaiticus]|uniref:Prenyltransferase n=1 Tax=Arenibacter nanhaiticus TaxID=558155 RepID=A0A1M6ESW0_9FLAO|nr:hypothetical protein [Arenibacter nanhaiticus]SHI88430.1 hypothetical protein SAMN04487911_10736 [Arenibacter nanhaiticus]